MPCINDSPPVIDGAGVPTVLTNTVPPDNYVATPFHSNRWSELIVNVQDHQVTVWKDGRRVLNRGFTGYPVPSPAARALGFSVGARPGPAGVGVEPCQGIIDDLELYNYPPEGFLALAEAGHTTYAEALTNPTAIRLNWRHTVWLEYTNPPARVAIDRRPHGWGGTWTNIATNQTGFQFTDSSIALGQLYDYRFRVQRNGQTVETLPGLTAAVEAPPVLDRGHVLLLVDNTLTNVLSNELEQFTLDLVGDGWQVLTENVPRHNDADWSTNTSHILAIRSTVQAKYQTPGIQLKTLIIIGHVAIPYTGMLAEDSHVGWLNPSNPASDNHFGAWSSDLYYADMNGVWTDARLYDHPWGINAPATRYLITTNTVGDGKFDNNWVPEDAGTNNTYRLELGVGRIDFANLDIFNAPPTSLDEVGLLKRYFQKNHRFRHGQTPVSARALGRSFREHTIVRDLPAHGQRSLARLFAGSPDGLAEGDFLAATNGLAYLWGYQFGYGDIDAIRNGDALFHYAATNLVYPERQPRVAYAMCFGSWFGDWNLGDSSRNNLLRSYLSIEDYGLMAMWGYRPWPFLGLTRGHGAWRAQVDYFDYYSEIEPARFFSLQDRSLPRVLGILGDPTLGWTPVPVPGEASATTNLAGRIVVSWQPVAASQPRYHLRYSQTGPLGPFTTISPLAGTGATSLVHSNAPATRPLWYQVRASVLSRASSGSSWNLSQAAVTVLQN